MTTFIDFQFDPDTMITSDQRKQLPGSFNSPVAIDHPPVRYRTTTDAPWTVLQKPDFPVPVASGDTVLITVSSPEPGSKYVMAPDRFLPIKWFPDQGPPSDGNDLLLNGDNTPIQVPQFGVNHPTNYTLAYQGAATPWQPDSDNPVFAQYGIPSDCLNVSRQTQAVKPALFAPYVSVEVADIAGTLSYGLQIRIISLTTGKDLGWVFWDPALLITSSGGTSQFFRRQR